MPSIAKVEPLTTARALRGPFDYLIPEPVSGTVKVGSLLVVPFAGRELVGVVVGLAESSELPMERLAEPVELLQLALPEELVRLSLWLARRYCSTPARALNLALPPGLGLGGRRRKRLAAPSARSKRKPIAQVGVLAGAVPELTGHQQAVLGRLESALQTGKSAEFLLQGVTGSGKTEVYMQAVEQALALGRGAIVLVPEIALTPQTASRFVARFGDTVAVIHSQLGSGERFNEWLRLSRGEARICVGPRSAIFAPIEPLGLIVIDEEHDSSYKNEGDPRYDARTVAARRAELADAVLVAGSATPRAESYHRLNRLLLPDRVDGQALPPVEVLDMRPVKTALHPDTREALELVKEREEKAIVLLNRRGWSNFLSCRSCGRIWQCPNCDVSLVLHRAEDVVSCHHCGWREPVPKICPDCDSVSVARHGSGTERLAQELAQLFGSRPGSEGVGFPVFRLDSDAVSGKDGTARLLERFDSAPAGVLVGTQMVAKGHDFPTVTLAVVVDADSTLHFPDFRAEERTFQLITQLAGRAGRSSRGGKVLVQTVSPSAISIGFAARHDSDGFLTSELERRAALNYPPFAELIRVVCHAPTADLAQAACQEVLSRSTLGGQATALGPAPLFRLRGKERSQLVIKTTQLENTVGELGQAVAAVAGERAYTQVNFAVDVEPQ